MNQDESQLDLLAVFHYVVGGITAFFACIPIIHVIIGIFILINPDMMEPRGDPFPASLCGLIFIIFPGAMVLGGWSLAVCVIVAGRFLARRKHHQFCLVVAGIECIFVPIGTILGIFTIIVLMRESVREIFSAEQT
jgi:hypothetical protein